MGWSCAISNISRFSRASANPLRGRGDGKSRFGVVENITHVRIGGAEALRRLRGPFDDA